MRLSSQKDLLMVIIISLAVLTMSWLQLFKGDVLTFIQYFTILLIPGYAIITAIWPTDDRIGWSLRLGVGFVLGLFFVLFLPLIFDSLKMGSISGNLSTILLTLAILLSLVSMVRRREPYEEDISRDGAQLTLEESIQRATEMRHRSVEEHEDVYEDEEYEYYDEDSEYEEVHEESEEEYEEVPDEDEEYYEAHGESEEEPDETEPEKYEDLKEEKPLQYERMRKRGYLDEELPEDERYKSVPLSVEEHIKTEPHPTEYEEEMSRPVWMDDEVERKPGFKYWDIILMLLLSGISLFFLYFNPLKTETTSMIFFVLLLFILGYAFQTIIFPDKSRVSLRILIMTSGILAVALFILAFLAYAMELLPSIPKYMINILFVVSIILIGSAFIRKWQSLRVSPEQDIREEEIIEYPEEIPTERVSSAEKVQITDTKTSEEKPTPAPAESRGIVSDKKFHKEPPTYKPRNYYMDIILIVTLTLLTAAFVLIPPLNKTFIRTILGILLVLFIPGYSLIAALFPKWGDLDGIERAALSFGLSIAVTPLIGLALNYTPWGIRLDPILISLTIFTLTLCLITYLRRRNLTEEERFFVPFGEFVKGIRGSFQGESKTERILSIILIISIILAIATTAYIIIKPKEGEKFTEFYILGPEGKASNYPTNLTTGQNGSVIIGVVNHEYATKEYHLMVRVNGNTLKNETITLTNGQKMEIPFNFTAGTNGQKKMEFLLYKLPDEENVYRSLHLWLNIA